MAETCFGKSQATSPTVRVDKLSFMFAVFSQLYLNQFAYQLPSLDKTKTGHSAPETKPKEEEILAVVLWSEELAFQCSIIPYCLTIY